MIYRCIFYLVRTETVRFNRHSVLEAYLKKGEKDGSIEPIEVERKKIVL